MKATAKRVFILGIDGVGNANTLIDTPNMDRVFLRGVYTDKAIAAIPTDSAECWGAILTGVSPEKHGLTNDIVESGQPYPADSPYPTIFRLVRTAYPNCELASFSNWKPINTGIIEPNLGCHLVSKRDAELPDTIAKYLDKYDPKLLFLQMDDCDGAGHVFGYFTQKHLEAVQRTDEYLGCIMDCIESKGMWDDSLIFIVTDHGGGGDGPGDHGSDKPSDITVFWGCCGPGIRQGAVPEEPVHIADTAAVALKALGIEHGMYFDGKIPQGVFAGV